MMRVITSIALFVLVATALLVGGSVLADAGANPDHKIAVHVVADGLSCKNLPAFTECSQIVTTYADSGDIDVVPVFFGLSECTVVEFGLTWPAGIRTIESAIVTGERGQQCGSK